MHKQDPRGYLENWKTRIQDEFKDSELSKEQLGDLVDIFGSAPLPTVASLSSVTNRDNRLMGLPDNKLQVAKRVGEMADEYLGAKAAAFQNSEYVKSFEKAVNLHEAQQSFIPRGLSEQYDEKSMDKYGKAVSRAEKVKVVTNQESAPAPQGVRELKWGNPYQQVMDVVTKSGEGSKATYAHGSKPVQDIIKEAMANKISGFDGFDDPREAFDSFGRPVIRFSQRLQSNEIRAGLAPKQYDLAYEETSGNFMFGMSDSSKATLIRRATGIQKTEVPDELMAKLATAKNEKEKKAAQKKIDGHKKYADNEPGDLYGRGNIFQSIISGGGSVTTPIKPAWETKSDPDNWMQGVGNQESVNIFSTNYRQLVDIGSRISIPKPEVGANSTALMSKIADRWNENNTPEGGTKKNRYSTEGYRKGFINDAETKLNASQIPSLDKNGNAASISAGSTKDARRDYRGASTMAGPAMGRMFAAPDTDDDGYFTSRLGVANQPLARGQRMLLNVADGRAAYGEGSFLTVADNNMIQKREQVVLHDYAGKSIDELGISPGQVFSKQGHNITKIAEENTYGGSYDRSGTIGGVSGLFGGNSLETMIEDIDMVTRQRPVYNKRGQQVTKNGELQYEDYQVPVVNVLRGSAMGQGEYKPVAGTKGSGQEVRRNHAIVKSMTEDFGEEAQVYLPLPSKKERFESLAYQIFASESNVHEVAQYMQQAAQSLGMSEEQISESLKYRNKEGLDIGSISSGDEEMRKNAYSVHYGADNSKVALQASRMYVQDRTKRVEVKGARIGIDDYKALREEYENNGEAKFKAQMETEQGKDWETKLDEEGQKRVKERIEAARKNEVDSRIKRAELIDPNKMKRFQAIGDEAEAQFDSETAKNLGIENWKSNLTLDQQKYFQAEALKRRQAAIDKYKASDEYEREASPQSFYKMDYVADAIQGYVLGDMLPINVNKKASISADYMNEIARNQPKVFEELSRQIDSGVIKSNKAASMIQTQRANMFTASGLSEASQEVRANMRKTVDGSGLDFEMKELEAKAALGKGATKPAIKKYIMNSLADEHKASFVQVGDTMLAPMATLADDYVVDPTGRETKNSAYYAYDVMRKYSEDNKLYEAAETQEEKAKIKSRINNRAARYLKTLNTEVDRPDIREKGTRFTIDAPGGHATAINGIPEEMKVLDAKSANDYIARLAKDKANQENIDVKEAEKLLQKQFKEEGLWGISSMSSANRDQMWQRSHFVSDEWLRGDKYKSLQEKLEATTDDKQRKRLQGQILKIESTWDKLGYGSENIGQFGDVQVSEGTVSASAQFIRGQNKDADGDNVGQHILTLLGRDDINDMSRGNVNKYKEAVGTEFATSSAKFANNIEDYLAQGFANPNKVKELTLDSVKKSNEEGSESTRLMANTFTPFIRTMYSSMLGGARDAGIAEDSEQEAYLREATDSGTTIYQHTMDKNPLMSNSSLTLMSAVKEMSLQSDKNIYPMLTGPTFGQAFDKETKASNFMFDALATHGMHRFEDEDENKEAWYGTERSNNRGLRDTQARMLMRYGDIKNLSVDDRAKREEEIKTVLDKMFESRYKDGSPLDIGIEKLKGPEGEEINKFGSLPGNVRASLIGAITGTQTIGDDKKVISQSQVQEQVDRYMGMHSMGDVGDMSAASHWISSHVMRNTLTRSDKMNKEAGYGEFLEANKKTLDKDLGSAISAYGKDNGLGMAVWPYRKSLLDRFVSRQAGKLADSGQAMTDAYEVNKGSVSPEMQLKKAQDLSGRQHKRVHVGYRKVVEKSVGGSKVHRDKSGDIATLESSLAETLEVLGQEQLLGENPHNPEGFSEESQEDTTSYMKYLESISQFDRSSGKRFSPEAVGAGLGALDDYDGMSFYDDNNNADDYSLGDFGIDDNNVPEEPPGFAMLAHGGELGEDVTIVGERGPEAIVKKPDGGFQVVDADTTEKMFGQKTPQELRSTLPGAKFKAEGDLKEPEWMRDKPDYTDADYTGMSTPFKDEEKKPAKTSMNGTSSHNVLSADRIRKNLANRQSQAPQAPQAPQPKVLDEKDKQLIEASKQRDQGENDFKQLGIPAFEVKSGFSSKEAEGLAYLSKIRPDEVPHTGTNVSINELRSFTERMKSSDNADEQARYQKEIAPGLETYGMFESQIRSAPSAKKIRDTGGIIPERPQSTQNTSPTVPIDVSTQKVSLTNGREFETLLANGEAAIHAKRVDDPTVKPAIEFEAVTSTEISGLLSNQVAFEDMEMQRGLHRTRTGKDLMEQPEFAQAFLKKSGEISSVVGRVNAMQKRGIDYSGMTENDHAAKALMKVMNGADGQTIKAAGLSDEAEERAAIGMALKESDKLPPLKDFHNNAHYKDVALAKSVLNIRDTDVAVGKSANNSGEGDKEYNRQVVRKNLNADGSNALSGLSKSLLETIQQAEQGQTGIGKSKELAEINETLEAVKGLSKEELPDSLNDIVPELEILSKRAGALGIKADMPKVIDQEARGKGLGANQAMREKFKKGQIDQMVNAVNSGTGNTEMLQSLKEFQKLSKTASDGGLKSSEFFDGGEEELAFAIEYGDAVLKPTDARAEKRSAQAQEAIGNVETQFDVKGDKKYNALFKTKTDREKRINQTKERRQFTKMANEWEDNLSDLPESERKAAEESKTGKRMKKISEQKEDWYKEDLEFTGEEEAAQEAYRSNVKERASKTERGNLRGRSVQFNENRELAERGIMGQLSNKPEERAKQISAMKESVALFDDKTARLESLRGSQVKRDVDERETLEKDLQGMSIFDQHRDVVEGIAVQEGAKRQDAARVSQAKEALPSVLGSAEGLKSFQGSIAELAGPLSKFSTEAKRNVGVMQEMLKVHDNYSKIMEAVGGSTSEGGKKIQEALGPIAKQMEEIGANKEGLEKNIAKHKTQATLQRNESYEKDMQENMLMESLTKRGFSGKRTRMGDQYDELAAKGLDLGWGMKLGGEKGEAGRTALEAYGGGLRTIKSLQGTMFSAMMTSNQIIKPMGDMASAYEARQANRSQTLMQTGSMSFDDMLSSEFGARRRRSANMDDFKMGVGEQIYNTWSGIANGAGGETAGRNLGAIGSVLGPAVGAAMLGNSVAGPVGGAIAGLGAGAFGAYQFATQATNDVQGNGRALYNSNQNKGTGGLGNVDIPLFVAQVMGDDESDERILNSSQVIEARNISTLGYDPVRHENQAQADRQESQYREQVRRNYSGENFDADWLTARDLNYNTDEIGQIAPEMGSAIGTTNLVNKLNIPAIAVPGGSALFSEQYNNVEDMNAVYRNTKNGIAGSSTTTEEAVNEYASATTLEELSQLISDNISPTNKDGSAQSLNQIQSNLLVESLPALRDAGVIASGAEGDALGIRSGYLANRYMDASGGPEIEANQTRLAKLEQTFGGNYAEMAFSSIGESGINRVNDDDMKQVFQDFTEQIEAFQARGMSTDEITATVQADTQARHAVNSSLAGANMDVYQPMAFVDDPRLGDPYSMGRYTQAISGAAQLATQTDFGGAIYNDYTARQDELTRSGDLMESSRLEGRVGGASSIYNRLAMYNGSDAASAAIPQLYDMAQNLSNSQFSQAQAILGGDQYAASYAHQEARGRGETDGLGQGMYNLIDTETGLNPYMMNISAEEAETLHQFDYAGTLEGRDLEGESPITYQREMRQTQYQQQDRQYEAGRNTSIAQYSTMFNGNSFSLAPLESASSEFAEQLKGLSGGMETTTKIFKDFGFQFNQGDGRGQRQLEDDQIRTQRAATLRGQDQQELSLDMGDQGRALRWNQFFENQGFSREKAGYQAGRQREDMDLDRSMQLTQRTWQREDMSMQRSQNELGFGWNMEDMDLNLRYARGRDRRQIMKQQERAVITQGMERSKMDRQEDRFEVKSGTEDVKYQRSEQDFSKGIEFQQRGFEMQERHFREQFALDEQQAALARTRFAQEKADQEALWGIEDQRRLIERQFQELQISEQMEFGAEAQANALKLRGMSEILTGIGESAGNVGAKFTATRNSLQGLADVYTTMGKSSIDAAHTVGGSLKQMNESFGGSMTNFVSTAQDSMTKIITAITNGITALSGTLPTVNSTNITGSGSFGGTTTTKSTTTTKVIGKAEGGYMGSLMEMQQGAPKVMSMAGGGYTGDGFKYNPAGSAQVNVHSGEYIVPQSGVPVVRGDNQQSVEELRRIRVAIEKLASMGLYNVEAHITTGDSKVKASDINPIDMIYQQ